MLVRVESSYFVAGLEMDRTERCVRAAPIIGWAVGLDRIALKEEFQRRGWHASVIGEGTHRHPLLRVRDRE